jgi:hypothetical protein
MSSATHNSSTSNTTTTFGFLEEQKIHVSFFHLPTFLLFYNNNLHWYRNGKKK